MSFVYKQENIPSPLFQSDSSLPTPTLYRMSGTGNNDGFTEARRSARCVQGDPQTQISCYSTRWHVQKGHAEVLLRALNVCGERRLPGGAQADVES